MVKIAHEWETVSQAAGAFEWNIDLFSGQWQTIKHKLSPLVSIFIPWSLAYTATDFQKTIKIIEMIHKKNQKSFVVFSDTKKEKFDNDIAKLYAKNMDILGNKILDHFGMRSLIHPNRKGCMDQPEKLDIFLSLTTPRAMGLCFDSRYYRTQKETIVEQRKYGRRCRLFYVEKNKDKEILEVLEKQNYRGWVIKKNEKL